MTLPKSLFAKIAAAVFVALLVLCAYWPGLQGPWLLDDDQNLASLWRYLDGQLSAMGAIMDNRSGLFGRPLSMLSFWLDALSWGRAPFGFKLTNLLLHLTSAAVLWALLSRLLRRDPALARWSWLPLWLAVLWTALPISTSTVLYIVQRMAILSTLLIFLALLAYARGREFLECGSDRRAWAMLLLVFPALTVAAMLAKENGVLAVPLAAAIEYFLFRTRPATLRIGWFVLLGVPAMAVAGQFVQHPQRLLDAYAGRDFTLSQRLLTEPRILWDYVLAILVPNGPMLGLFHDNYPKSTGLLSPPSTLLAILAWLAMLAAAWRLQHHARMFSLGVSFFLIAHALESTVWPLELYFEHRNYLASVGVLLALSGLASLAIPSLPRATPLMRRALTLLALLVPATYLLATHGRALVWASEETLYAQEVLHNPSSPRLNSTVGALAMSRGDLRGALHYFALAERGAPATERMAHVMRRMLAYCATGNAIPFTLYAQAERTVDQPVTQYGMVAWEMLAEHAEAGKCPSDRLRLARIGMAWANQPVRPGSHWNWRVRYNAARLFAAGGDMPLAAQQSARAFVESQHNFGVGVLAFQTCASLGDVFRCNPIAKDLQRLANPEDRAATEAARRFVEASTRNGKH